MSGLVPGRAERFRAEVLTHEARARAEMRRAWSGARETASAEIDRLVAEALERGADEDTLRALVHYERFVRRATAEASAFAETSRRRTVSLAAWASDAGASAAGELVGLATAQVGAVATVQNAEAVIAITGRMRAGGAARAFAAIPARSVARAERELIDGVALGRNPRETARRMRAAFDIALFDAERIARNETMCAYRMAHQQTYRANTAALSGWKWVAALDARTCAICWAWDGTVFPVESGLDTHVGCRCTMAPVPIGYEDLVDAGPSGPERFARLPRERQDEILGPGRAELYRSGVALKSMTGATSHPLWGSGRTLLPLKAMAA